MLSYSFLCSSSYSYLVNYTIQSKMYEWIDKVNEKEEIKSLTLGVCCVSALATTVTRVCGLAETFFYGLLLLVSLPCKISVNNNETGLQKVFVHTPKNILRTLVIPFEFIFQFIHAFYEPKAFTLDKLHEMKVNLIHAKAGTIGSPSHNDDLSVASGIAYGSHLNWERRKKGLMEAIN